MHRAILLIDIGNTRTTLGVAAVPGGRVAAAGVHHVPTRSVTAAAAAAAVRRLCAGRRLAGVLAVSVVPTVQPVWARAVRQTTGLPLQWIGPDRPWNFTLRYPHPETLGADRLVNLCGALRRYRPPLIVLDFGTALTVDPVNARGEFRGGMIAPGFGLLADGLTRRTALLPALPLRIGRMPATATGRNTRAAMRAGILLGYRGLVRELITAAAAPFGGTATVCATGGYAAAMMAALPEIPCRVHPRLTLEGVATAYDLAAPRAGSSSSRPGK